VVCGAVLQCVLQCVAVFYSMLQCVIVCHSVLWCMTVCYCVLQYEEANIIMRWQQLVGFLKI